VLASVGIAVWDMGWYESLMLMKPDRIDFVFASPIVTIRKSEVLGEQAKSGDIIITLHPSDHRAAAADVEIP
jgi:hypothetical protein